MPNCLNCQKATSVPNAIICGLNTNTIVSSVIDGTRTITFRIVDGQSKPCESLEQEEYLIYDFIQTIPDYHGKFRSSISQWCKHNKMRTISDFRRYILSTPDTPFQGLSRKNSYSFGDHYWLLRLTFIEFLLHSRYFSSINSLLRKHYDIELEGIRN